MHFGTKKALILASFFIFSATLIFDPPSAWASRKLSQQSRLSDIERSLSANESLLNRFIQEREQMLKSNERYTSPLIYRNKLTIINNKITFLEQEIKRTKPRILKNKTAPMPIIVSPKNEMSPEPRKGYFLAYSSTLAKFLSPNKTDERNPPEQGVLHPVAVTPLTANVSESRQPAAQAVMPLKIQPIPATTLPSRQEAETIQPTAKPVIEEEEAPIVLAPADTEVRRYFPMSGQEPVKGDMAILNQPEPDKPKVRTARTGKDWKTMTDAEREIYVLSVMGNLSRRDVFLMKSYNFYINSVDRSLSEDPSLEHEYVHKIIMNNAYASEPESRKDLERVWR